MTRPNSLQVIISTADYERQHIAYETFLHAKALQAGERQDLHTLAVVYTLPIHDDWTLEENWIKTNPSIGLTIPIEYYRREYEQCKLNPQSQSRFRTWLLNQFLGSPSQFISCFDWEPNTEPFNESDLWGSEAIVGIDSAVRYDLACTVLIVKRDDLYYLLPRFFIPEALAKRKENSDPGSQYGQWEKDGFVYFTEGDVIDPAKIREVLYEDAEHFKISEIRFDKFGLEESRQILEKDFDCLEITQNPATLSPSTALFEKLVKERKFRCNNPCADWNVANAAVRIKQQDLIMVDSIRSKGRIDFVQAVVTAMTAFVGQDTKQRWEDRPFCMVLP